MAPTRFSSGPSLWSFSFPLRVGYRACLYGRVSYPISMPACPAFNSERRRESEKPTGNQREKIDGKERGSLQSENGPDFCLTQRQRQGIGLVPVKSLLLHQRESGV